MKYQLTDYRHPDGTFNGRPYVMVNDVHICEGWPNEEGTALLKEMVDKANHYDTLKADVRELSRVVQWMIDLRDKGHGPAGWDSAAVACMMLHGTMHTATEDEKPEPEPPAIDYESLINYDGRGCDCESGSDSGPVNDAQGIYLCRACPHCVEHKLRGYRPEILTGYTQADVNEPIEPEEG